MLASCFRAMTLRFAMIWRRTPSRPGMNGDKCSNFLENYQPYSGLNDRNIGHAAGTLHIVDKRWKRTSHGTGWERRRSILNRTSFMSRTVWSVWDQVIMSRSNGESPRSSPMVSACVGYIQAGESNLNSYANWVWYCSGHNWTGWWYGVVGHLEPCDRNQSYCHCHENGEILVLDLECT